MKFIRNIDGKIVEVKGGWCGSVICEDFCVCETCDIYERYYLSMGEE